MPSRVFLAVAALVLGPALQACGGLASSKRGDAGPQGAAENYLRALVGGRCAEAATYLDAPTALSAASCRDAYMFSLACEEIPGSGNPQGEECGPGTRITVRSVQARKPEFTGKTARIAVVVTYAEGRHTKRERTIGVELRRIHRVWKVTKSS